MAYTVSRPTHPRCTKCKCALTIIKGAIICPNCDALGLWPFPERKE